MNVGKLKSNFSKVLEQVKNGEEITITYGKKKEEIAVIVPISKYKKPKKNLGLLKNKGKIIVGEDFELTDEEFLNL